MRRMATQTLRRYQTITEVVSAVAGATGTWSAPSNFIDGSLYVEASSPSGGGAASVFLSSNGGGGTSCSYCGGALASVTAPKTTAVAGIKSRYTAGSTTAVADLSGVLDGEGIILYCTAAAAVNWATAPSGWVRLATGSMATVAAYTKIASGEGATLNITNAISGNCTIVTVRVSNPDPVQFVDAFSQNFSSPTNTTCITPAVTTTVANAKILSFATVGTSKTMTQPSGTTNIALLTATMQAYVNEETKAVAGSSGTRTWSWSGNTVVGGLNIAIRPYSGHLVPWVNGTKSLGVSGAVASAATDTTVGTGPLFRAKAGVSGAFGAANSAGGVAPTTGNLGTTVVYGNNGSAASGTGGLGAAGPTFPANPITGLSNFSPGAATGSPGGNATGFNGNADGGGASGGGAGTTKGGDGDSPKIVFTYKVVL